MKKLLLLSTFFFLASLLFAQEQIINSFDTASPDTNYWAWFDEQYGGVHYQTNTSAVEDSGYLYLSHPTDNVYEGTGAFRLEYSAHNTESWGGYTKLEHWNPDSNAVYDWSLYDTLSLWYNNVTAQSQPGRVHLRVNLHDVSDSPNGPVTYSVNDVEYYYSFQYVLDEAPGWHQLKIPMVNNYNWDGNGFNLTGWAGIPGNQTLNKDQIKGFSFEFSINGGGEGDRSYGVVLLDKMFLTGIAERPVVFFNGAAIPSTVNFFVWGGAAEVEAGAGATPESPNAIRWSQDGAWTGVGFSFDPIDLSFHWQTDTLKFKMKAEAGTGNLRIQWEDGANRIGTNFDPIADGAWHQYNYPLRELTTYYDGATTFNYDNCVVMQILTEGTGSGKVVYIDDWWTGNPSFDVLAPDAPGLVTAAPGEFVNLVTWIDVPGEVDEVYDVYYSFAPVTDLSAEGVEVVKLGVEEGLQVVEHVLLAPKENQDLTYYYAVVCKDAAGNASEIAQTSSPLTNTAKGVTVIHPAAPPNFVADGELDEWTNITPFRIFPSDGSGTIVTNTDIDGDADCSANAYLAMDDEYLYVAFQVNDDIISSNPNIASYLRDAPDLFIGLYDWHGASHTSYKRAAEPDYQWRFNQTSAIIGNLGDTEMATPGDGNYAWVEKFPSGYAVEGKFAFAAIAAVATPDDALFVPEIGKRIKLDFSINDADATGSREGILTFSPNNQDQSWADVSRWTYTWIGDSMSDVIPEEGIPTSFDLSQNYPNPFNPATKIKYSIKERSDVTIKVFNMLGQEVAILVNEVHSPGVYSVDFNASNLASGVYVYQINAGSFVSARKMMLVK